MRFEIVEVLNWWKVWPVPLLNFGFIISKSFRPLYLTLTISCWGNLSLPSGVQVVRLVSGRFCGRPGNFSRSRFSVASCLVAAVLSL